MLRALVGGLLVAVGTALSLIVGDVHRVMIAVVVRVLAPCRPVGSGAHGRLAVGP